MSNIQVLNNNNGISNLPDSITTLYKNVAPKKQNIV